MAVNIRRRRLHSAIKGVWDPVHAWKLYDREPGDLHSL